MMRKLEPREDPRGSPGGDMQQVELRGDDEESFLHPSELEEEIRRGRVLSSAEIRYAPWTGTEFARIETIATLASAVDAPAARAAARLARKPLPWATALLCVLLLVAFGLQLWLGLRGMAPERMGAVGFEPPEEVKQAVSACDVP
jgi:rhomboid protease GluP